MDSSAIGGSTECYFSLPGNAGANLDTAALTFSGIWWSGEARDRLQRMLAAISNQS
jgi:hypothetical protein